MTQTKPDMIGSDPDGSIFLPPTALSDREVAAYDFALLTGRYPDIREALQEDERAAIDEARLLQLRVRIGKRATS